MRIRIVILAAAIALCVAAPASAQAPAGDSVVGSDQGPRSSGRVVDAHSGPAGENATGTVDVRFGFTGGFHANVVCLAVSGNYAVVGYVGTFEQFFPERTGPVTGILQIVDNGPPVGNESPDVVVEHSTLDSTTQPDCAAAGPAPVGFGGFSGDYVVTDAPALPTTKDQCKHGGWRNFGDRFRNQGQCVAFVQRGPKP